MGRYYQAISADGHLETAENFWPRHLSQKYLERAPRLVSLDDGTEGWIVEGQPLYSNGRVIFGGRKPIKTSGVSYFNSDGSPAPGTGDGVQRLQEQDLDGIDAEVLFPAVQGSRLLWNITDSKFYLALVQAYNNFLAEEYCSVAPDRLIGVGVIPISGIDDAVATLKQIKELGLRAAILHKFPNGGGRPKPEDDRFWATALELGVALSPHGSFGDTGSSITAAQRGKEDWVMHLGGLGGGHGCIYTTAQLIAAGVFDRFPDLQIMFAETNAGWMPFEFYMFDDRYDIYREGFNVEYPMPPTGYIRKHLQFSFVRDPWAVKLGEYLDMDRLMWSSDFPHGVTSFPESRKWIDIIFEGASEDVKRKMLVDNAAKYYGLDTTKPITETPTRATAGAISR